MSLVLGNKNNNGYIDHGDISAIDGATALTLACWVRGGLDFPVDIGKGKEGITSDLMLFQVTTGQRYMIRERLADLSLAWVLMSDQNVISTDLLDWDHFAMVYDGTLAVTSRVTVYKNAVSLPLVGPDGISPQGTDASSTAPTSFPDTSPYSLENGNANVSGLTGHLRLWSVALTQGEVAQEVHRYWANRRTNLVLDAPYDDSLDPRDYSGAGNHGTWDRLFGTPGLSQGPPVAYGGKVLVTG